MEHAPIVLFVYNRPEHTKKTLEALAKNTLAIKSDLFIYSDAAKKEEHRLDVDNVRTIIKTTQGFKTVTVNERPFNYGLAKSIVEGVTEIIGRFGKLIVLEDDLITHPQFLDFMNEGLTLYEKNEKVFQITGYSHLRKKSEISTKNQAFFLTIISTWGWATWENRWKSFNSTTLDSSVIDKVKLRKYNFNFNNSYNYYKMLLKKFKGSIQSWGIAWYVFVFNNDGLTLYPFYSLIDQLGFDGSGENSRNYRFQEIKVNQNTNYNFIFPELAREQKKNRNYVAKTLRYRKIRIVMTQLKKYVLRLKNLNGKI